MRSKSFVLRLMILGAIILMSFAPVSSAAAAVPVIERGTFEDTKKLDWQPCPGIEVWDHLTGTYQVISRFDNSGNLSKIQVFYYGVDNMYTPQNPGVVLSGNFNVTGQIDLQTGDSINVSGIDAHITIPGYGKVVFLTGHYIHYPDLHLGGLDSFQDPADMAIFCSALAGK